LEKHFEEIVDASFTANMEETLDEIGEEGKSWHKIILDFYHPFMAKIDAGKTDIVSLKVATPLGRNCPQCGSELLLRSGRFGEFIACSGFPKCKYTEQTKEAQKANPATADEASEEVCEKCGSPMVIKSGRNGQFLACSADPECKNTKTLNQEIKFSEVPCPDCGGKLMWRQSRRGAFWGCESYPKCKFISKFEPSLHKCEVEGCGGALAPRTYRNKEIFECTKCKNRTPNETASE
jgi:DNA topoisomerase-1